MYGQQLVFKTENSMSLLQIFYCKINPIGRNCDARRAFAVTIKHQEQLLTGRTRTPWTIVYGP